MSFTELSLDPVLVRAIERSGYTQPTDIQREAIPLALAGRDLMASAQTGTGKTAAFVLPALQRLLSPASRAGIGPRVLVLTPTRELATQVAEAISSLGQFTRLRSGAIVGGMPYPPQQRLLRENLDLLIATPGRLMDHMERGRVDFSRLELLVLDEADRMLDMGFVDAVEQIAAATPSDRQTLLFSATFEGQVQRVAKRLLQNPAEVQINSVTARHESITQLLHQADDFGHKKALLERILEDEATDQAIVFTATKRGADELADTLRQNGHRSVALHGDMSQYERRRARARHPRALPRGELRPAELARGLCPPHRPYRPRRRHRHRHFAGRLPGLAEAFAYRAADRSENRALGAGRAGAPAS